MFFYLLARSLRVIEHLCAGLFLGRGVWKLLQNVNSLALGELGGGFCYLWTEPGQLPPPFPLMIKNRPKSFSKHTLEYIDYGVNQALPHQRQTIKLQVKSPKALKRLMKVAIKWLLLHI